MSRATAFGACGAGVWQGLLGREYPDRLMHLAWVFQDDPAARGGSHYATQSLHSLIFRGYLPTVKNWWDRSPDQVRVVDLDVVKIALQETYVRMLMHICLPPAEIASDAKSNSSFVANDSLPKLALVDLARAAHQQGCGGPRIPTGRVRNPPARHVRVTRRTRGLAIPQSQFLFELQRQLGAMPSR